MGNNFVKHFFRLGVDVFKYVEDLLIGLRANRFDFVGVKEFGFLGNDFVILNVNRRFAEEVFIITRLDNQRVLNANAFGQRGVAVSVDD